MNWQTVIFWSAATIVFALLLRAIVRDVIYLARDVRKRGWWTR